MALEFDLSLLLGAMSTIVLSLIAYFIKQLHTDFKRVQRDLVEVKTTTQIIKTEFRSDYQLVTQHLEYLEKRVSNLENLTKTKIEV